MDTSNRCQSCGMRLSEGFFGTETDGSFSSEYCKFCYAQGVFTNPNMTVEEMIASSVDNMVNQVKLPKEQAEQLANDVIPHLKRWKA